MNEPIDLLQRLDDIGRSLERYPDALALLGLGSVGTELDRLDAHSDLDFFVVTAPGRREAFIEDLSWLSDVAPVVYAFRNTADGYKALFSDGIFCEFAVFELPALLNAAYAEGRVVWKRPEVAATIAAPARPSAAPRQPDAAWLAGEAVTNLYVGLERFARGEKLSAARFIQGYAVDRLLALTAYQEVERPAHRDPFDPARRFEARFPVAAARLPDFMQGYERTPESAASILSYLSATVGVNPAMVAAISRLLAEIESARP